jgi:GTPase involved in cell partitioning and DNA repair
MVYYKVAEVAEMLKVSKVTIYEKLKTFKKELKPYLKLKGNATYIEVQGVDIIKSSLGLKEDLREVKSSLKVDLQEVAVCIENTYIESLKSEVNYLRQQLDTKDDQLKSKDDLLRNFQVLLKQEQDARLLLEEKSVEQQKNFWKRFFKNNK